MDGLTRCLVRANAPAHHIKQVPAEATQALNAHGMECMQTQRVCCLNDVSGAAADPTTRGRVCTCSIWESRRNHGNASMQNSAFHLSLCELVIVAPRWGTATAPGDPAAERVGAVGGSTFKVALKDMGLCCSTCYSAEGIKDNLSHSWRSRVQVQTTGALTTGPQLLKPLAADDCRAPVQNQTLLRYGTTKMASVQRDRRFGHRTRRSLNVTRVNLPAPVDSCSMRVQRDA